VKVRYNATPTAAVVLGGVVIAYVAAFAHKSLLGHLVGGLMLVFVGACFLLARRALSGVEVTRAVQTTAFDGDDLQINYTVSNAGSGTRSFVEVSSHFYGALAPSGETKALATEIPSGGTSRVSSVLRDLRRGDFVLAPPVVSSADPFGLVSVKREIDESECPSARVTVFPRTFHIESLAISSDLSWTFSGLEPTSRAGAGGDFLGTREYRFGDSVRTIHWPLSARMGQLIVKEFERTSSTEVTILLDLDARAVWGADRESTLEYSIRIAASVADYALGRGNAVQLVGHSSRFLRFPAGKGAYHQQTLMHFLATLQATGTTPFDVVINQVAPQLREGGSVVIIFPSQRLRLERLGPALEVLWARRVRVTAVVLDADSFSFGLPTLTPAVGPSAAYLVSRGASVYVVSCGGDLSRQLSVPL
jgi:uncharacterized protein (DUF58 family)